MKNRVTPYEAGWLTDLIRWGIASEAEAREAMNRVAQAALDELEARRQAKKKLKRKRKRDD